MAVMTRRVCTPAPERMSGLALRIRSHHEMPSEGFPLTSPLKLGCCMKRSIEGLVQEVHNTETKMGDQNRRPK